MTTVTRPKWTKDELLNKLAEIKGPWSTEVYPGFAAFWDFDKVNFDKRSDSDRFAAVFKHQTQNVILVINCTFEEWAGWEANWCTTAFKSGDHWLTFDRRGIDCSFTLSHRTEAFEKVVEEQLKKVDEYCERKQN